MAFTLPLLWLTVSGLVLRHAEALGLHEKRVRSPRLLHRYGMIPDGPARSSTTMSHAVQEWGGILFIDGVMSEDSGHLRGAVTHGHDLVVATSESLLVYGPSGQLVDQLGEESLPGTPLELVGTGPGGEVVVRVAEGSWKISEDFLSHQPAGTEVSWSTVETLGPSGRRDLERTLGEQAGISQYRLWLDLHSGNLFGLVGKIAVDLSAVGIIALTLLGGYLVVRKGRSNGGAS